MFISSYFLNHFAGLIFFSFFFVSINYLHMSALFKCKFWQKKSHSICRFYKVKVSCVQINWSVHLNWMWQQFGYRKVKCLYTKKCFVCFFSRITMNASVNAAISLVFWLLFFSIALSLISSLFISFRFSLPFSFTFNGYAFGTCYTFTIAPKSFVRLSENV